MGIFRKQQNEENNILNKQLEQYLAPKDGFTHVVMIKTTNNWVGKENELDVDYTLEIDSILTKMQQKGYEIIDVKNSVAKLSAGSIAGWFGTLITYK